MGHLLAALLLSGLVATVVNSQTPRRLAFAQSVYFGSDGPWQAVQVQIGKNQTYLYPGGSLASQVLLIGYCQNSGASDCSAAQGGFYDPDHSTSVKGDISWHDGLGQYQGDSAMNMTGFYYPLQETVQLDLDQGDQHFIPGFYIDAVNQSDIHLPNGSMYPSDLGTLSLGGPGLNRSLATDDQPLILNYSTG